MMKKPLFWHIIYISIAFAMLLCWRIFSRRAEAELQVRMPLQRQVGQALHRAARGQKEMIQRSIEAYLTDETPIIDTLLRQYEALDGRIDSIVHVDVIDAGPEKVAQMLIQCLKKQKNILHDLSSDAPLLRKQVEPLLEVDTFLLKGNDSCMVALLDNLWQRSQVAAYLTFSWLNNRHIRHDFWGKPDWQISVNALEMPQKNQPVKVSCRLEPVYNIPSVFTCMVDDQVFPFENGLAHIRYVFNQPGTQIIKVEFILTQRLTDEQHRDWTAFDVFVIP